MTNSPITAELINDLRRRVIAHNEQATITGARPTKINELKKIYAQAHRGDEPGVRAMRAVEVHLQKLEKAFDDSKHPRGKKGEFTAKGKRPVTITLPESPDAHEEMQDDSAGYRALTSEVIPEKRFETVGAAVRNVASLGLGAATIASILRGKPNGLAERAIAGSVALIGKHLAGFPTIVTAHAAASVAPRFVSRAAAQRVSEAARAKGAKYGAMLGGGTTRRLGSAGRYMVHLAGSYADSTGRPKTAAVHRALAFGGLSLGAGSIYNSLIQHVPFLDPETYGRTADNYGWRVVQKMASAGPLIDIHGHYVEELKKGATADDLRKITPHLTSIYGKSLFSALAGIAGGAIGRQAALRVAGVLAASALGGVAGEEIEQHSGKRGNPYRDAKGRFASRGAMAGVGGAIAGAAAAGGLALLGLKYRNQAVLRAAGKRIAGKISQVEQRAATGYSPGTPHNAHSILHANRSALVTKRAAENEELKAAVQNLEKYGGTSPVHYRAKIREEINRKIAAIVSGHDAFTIPKKTAGVTIHTPLGDIRGLHPSEQAGEIAAQEAAERAVDRMSLTEFTQAIKDLPDDVRADAMKWRVRRDEETAKVEPSLEKHLQDIDIAHNDVAAAKATTDAAAKVLDVKKRAVLAADAAGLDVAEAEHRLAKGEFDTAVAAEVTAKKHLDDLKTKGPKIVSIVTGKRIPPGTEKAIADRRSALIAAAQKRAEAHVDAQIAIARANHVKHVAMVKNRALAAHAMGRSGRLHEDLPGDLKVAARQFLAHHNAALQSEATLLHTQRAHELAQLDQKNLRALRGKNPSLSKINAGNSKAAQKQLEDAEFSGDQTAIRAARRRLTPAERTKETLTEEKADALRNDGEDVVKERADRAKEEFADAQAAHEKALSDVNSSAEAYRRALETSGQSKGRRLPKLGSVLPEALKRDVMAPVSGVRASAKRFLRTPSGKTFKKFVDSIKPAAKSKYAEAKSASEKLLVDTWHELFMRPVPGGKPDEFEYAPGKIIARYGLPSVGFAAGKEALDFARSKVFGTDEEAKKAQLPNSIKIERERDPVSGVGFDALVIRDPANPGRHMVLWGQKTHSQEAPSTRVKAGTDLSALRKAVQDQAQQQRERQNGQRNQQQGGGQKKSLGDAPGLRKEDKDAIDASIAKLQSANKIKSVSSGDGDFVEYRDTSDTEHNGTAGKMLNHIKQETGGKRLAAIFSAQGRILWAKQAYRLLTGYNLGGNKEDFVGAFKPNTAFGGNPDKDDVAGAVAEEIANHTKRLASDPTFRAHMHRAVAIIGAAKDLSPESVKSLHKQVDGGEQAAEAAPDEAEPIFVEPEPPRPTARARPPFAAGAAGSAAMPSHWDAMKLRNAAATHAEKLAPKMGMRTEADVHGLTVFIEKAANAVYHDNDGADVTEQEGAEAAAHAIETLIHGSAAHKSMGRQAVNEKDLDFYSGALRDAAEEILNKRDKKYTKFADLDDIDALAKAFNPLLKDAGSSIGAGDVVRNALDSGVEVAQLKAGQRLSSKAGAKPLGFFNPLRVANDLGGALAGDAAWKVAEHFASKFIPGGSAVAAAVDGSGLIGRAASAVKDAVQPRNLAIQGIGLAGGAVGGLAGKYAGDAAARAGYRAVGSTAPDYNVAQEGAAGTIGRVAGSFAGDLGARALVGRAIGSAAGEVLGVPLGPAGIVAGGAVGAWLAGEAGAKIGEYFSGYDKPTATKAMSRYVAGAGKRHAAVSPNTVSRNYQPMPTPSGSSRGDPYHDRVGRFTTSAGREA